MQLYILHKNPEKAAEMLPAKLGNINYAQKMLIELCQCLSNLLGNKYVDEKYYKYKAVPPEFTAFIFQNQEWVIRYTVSLLRHCENIYDSFNKTDTYNNCWYIFYYFDKHCSRCNANIYNAFFIPTKEYGERKYLLIDECIEEYRKYLEWKVKYAKQ